MKNTALAAAATIISLTLCAGAAQAQDAEPRWSLAIHGGAGVIERADLSPEQDAAYRAALSTALEAGAAVLRNGGSALDAVQAAVQLMEDDPLFNAGRGAVFTAAGANELDAAIMDGTDLNLGAVAGVTRTRPSHPLAPRRHGAVPPRHADRPGRRRLRRRTGSGAGGPVLVLHRAPLARAGQRP
ncbi:isoaspartyl peptidase/L-asparaginase [Brevundimonas denitrificans]|uniref:isoaspartyl peptidase/L-asparaginase n=1 Tax=Brevundimonas denitrificans TaxID=1443434 RepID=UPI00352E3189